ncbi:hypothetical protein HK100_006523 [Physocladia obscura]|uniref:G-patch domain-containing protein n=1 Tax=Physocladia obscura TaxID=109957 RepID=A0AAD5T7X9_9FUNG|nr:hypothetical protein HK100_006523 [Physocladia obscura]
MEADWRRYTQLSGDTKVVRFRQEVSISSQNDVADAADNHGESSASIYRSILSNAQSEPHSESTESLALAKQFQQTEKTDRKQLTQSIETKILERHNKNTTSHGIFCETCNITVNNLTSHFTQTSHLLASLQQTEHATEKPIIYAFSELDLGYKMLQRQGWRHGDSIGVDPEAGKKLPVAPKIKRDTAGLGGGESAKKSIRNLRRVGDSFRKPIAEQIQALEEAKLTKRIRHREEGNIARQRSRKEIITDANRARKKGLAVLAYLNE